MRRRLAYFLLLLTGLAVMAEAHPHVFADVSIKAVFSQDAFTGVQNHWSFDEVYSAAMVASADADGDGKITGKEANEINYLPFSLRILFTTKEDCRSRLQTGRRASDPQEVIPLRPGRSPSSNPHWCSTFPVLSDPQKIPSRM